MLPFLDEVLKKGHRKLFVIMHGYGEHWSYPDRYPSEFSFFKDDAPRGARPKEKEKLVNAYDNAIRYNDYFLDAFGVLHRGFYCDVLHFGPRRGYL